MDSRTVYRRGISLRRSLAVLVVLVGFTATVFVAPATAASPDRTELVPGTPGGPCSGSYDVVVHGNHHSCAHPDHPPKGVDFKTRDPLAAPGTTSSGADVAAAGGSVPCYGDGQSGNRVEAIYAYAVGATDRYSQVVGSIRTWAGAVDQVYVASAAQTGGVRHVRFVTDAACNLVVRDVAIPATAASDFAQTESALAQAGYNRSDRKYLVWMDANVYCGIGDVMLDDSASQTNWSNGGVAEYARVDTGCWGVPGQSVEAHELMHNLGGVQTSAPHATPAYHCSDESDRMCYPDGSGVAMRQVCSSSLENIFDCNHDDYFSTAPGASSYLASHWNTANSSFLANTDPVVAGSGRYVSLPPARILDTRSGLGGFVSSLGPAQSISVPVTGVGGVPSTGVSAVMLNVTVTQPTAASYLTVYPSGASLPLASNLNFVAGQTVPNMVMARVGAGGKVSIYNAAGRTHVIADVAGWFSDGSGNAPPGGQYTSVSPSRLLDTRNGTGGSAGALGAATSSNVTVTGLGGVPATGVSAVLLNVTVTQPTASGYLTVFPAGTAVPNASNLNFVAGQTVANMVVAKVGAGGQVSVYNAAGSAQVIVDVNGWYSDGSGSPVTGGFTNPLTPARILDTRNGTGAFSAPVGPGQSISVQVTGMGGVPSSGVSAVMLNLTATAPTSVSYLTVYPAGAPLPLASNLNFAAGQTVPNLVMAKVGAGGKISVYNGTGSTQVIADVAGWAS